MISEFFMNLVRDIVVALLSIIPTISLPVASLTGAFSWLASILDSVGSIIPLNVVSELVIKVYAIWTLTFMWYGFNWLLKRVPTQS